MNPPLGRKRPIVGIDLVPAGLRHRAPGTARLVEAQARELMALDVPWTWLPVVDGPNNPLFGEALRFHPIIHPVRRISVYSTFSLGRLWKQGECDLGFSPACLVPLAGPPVVANYFDGSFYEKMGRWSRQRRSFRHLWLRLLSRLALSRARTIFVLSDYGRQRLTATFPQHSRKFVVTPCGVDAPASTRATAPPWSMKIDRPFFLFVGECSDNKNQRALIRVWAELQCEHRDVPALVLLGPCTQRYRTTVLDPLHRAVPRPDEILIVGFAPESELTWAYQNAHAYIQSSIAEGFGLPVIEAMSYGLPVACSNTTSLPETAGGAAHLFDPSRPAEIAAAVLALWRDETLRAGLIRLGHEREKAFRWKRGAGVVAREIHGLLQQMDRLPHGPIPDYETSVRAV